MKYIRILTILAVALLLWTTAGCHADFMDDPAVAEPGVHIADTSRTGFISSKEDFVDVIGSKVDLSLYQEPDKITDDFHTDYTYHIKEENRTFFVTDYSITLSDGTKLILNHPFSELESQGWTIPDPEKSLDPGSMSWYTCKNDRGKELYIGIWNSTQKPLSVRECAVFQVKLDMFSKSDRFKPISTTPGFTVCETISHTSGLDEIISQLGQPEIIHYSSGSDPADAEIELLYNHYGNDYDWIDFYLSADGDYILNMAFSYIPHE